MITPELAACDRLTKDGAFSNAAIRRRIAWFAAERKLDPSETEALLKGRGVVPHYQLSQFVEKHKVSVSWLIGGELKGLLETVRGCPSPPQKANQTVDSITCDAQTLQFAQLVAEMSESKRLWLAAYMRELLERRSP